MPIDGLAGLDLQPLLEVSQPLMALALRHGFLLDHGHDDLDSYDAAALLLADQLPIVLLHYRGAPAGITTVLAPVFATQGVRRAVRSMVLKALSVSDSDIAWERPEPPRRSRRVTSGQVGKGQPAKLSRTA